MLRPVRFPLAEKSKDRTATPVWMLATVRCVICWFLFFCSCLFYKTINNNGFFLGSLGLSCGPSRISVLPPTRMTANRTAFASGRQRLVRRSLKMCILNAIKKKSSDFQLIIFCLCGGAL